MQLWSVDNYMLSIDYLDNSRLSIDVVKRQMWQVSLVNTILLVVIDMSWTRGKACWYSSSKKPYELALG